MSKSNLCFSAMPKHKPYSTTKGVKPTSCTWATLHGLQPRISQLIPLFLQEFPHCWRPAFFLIERVSKSLNSAFRKRKTLIRLLNFGFQHIRQIGRKGLDVEFITLKALVEGRHEYCISPQMLSEGGSKAARPHNELLKKIRANCIQIFHTAGLMAGRKAWLDFRFEIEERFDEG